LESNVGDQVFLPPFSDCNKTPIKPTATASDSLSLVSFMSPPPMMIAALQQREIDDEDWVLSPCSDEESSIIDEGDEVFFEGLKFRYLDQQQTEQALNSMLLGAEQPQQYPEDMLSASHSMSI
jgi:hypothetical protein